MKSVNEFVAKLFATSELTHNSRNNEIRRAFYPSERYVVDFADDFTSEGWLRFDTDQDAHYFGVWVNPGTMQTLTYAEGDWTLVNCPNRQSYASEIRDAVEFYGEGFIAKSIDDRGQVTVYKQDRFAMFLEPRVTK